MLYYAKIDEYGICFMVAQTKGEIDQANMIAIDSYDESLLGKKRVGDTWESVE